MTNTFERPVSGRRDTAVLLGLAAAMALLHLLTDARYGFHRDEWQFLSDAVHPAWGYVAYPPLTPFVERVAIALFGLAPVGLRLFSVLAQAACVYLAGDMARVLGGGRLAQVAAALSVAVSPVPLADGTMFQYTSFDYLWWMLVAWAVVRLVKSENPRWWLAVGLFAGLGFETKYAILFLVAGLLLGLLLTPERRWFLSPWFWAGVLLCALICLPNFLWQVRHGFIYLTFEHSIHARDVRWGRTKGYWLDQIWIDVNIAAVPLMIAGVIAGLWRREWRLLAVMAVAPVLLFALVEGRGYYSAGAYPVLLAMGAVAAEAWVFRISRPARVAVVSVFFVLVLAVGAYASACLVPFAADGPLKKFALSKSGDLREEIGWPEFVAEVARIYDALPAEQRAHAGIWAGNYGEYGALEFLGPKYGLPQPFGTGNSAWYRGYPQPAPTTLIVLGVSEEDRAEQLSGCRLAGHVTNPLGVDNEESSDHPGIYVCGPPQRGWPAFWADFQWFE